MSQKFVKHRLKTDTGRGSASRSGVQGRTPKGVWDEELSESYREERGGYKNHRVHPVCYSPQSSTGDRPERRRLKNEEIATF